MSVLVIINNKNNPNEYKIFNLKNVMISDFSSSTFFSFKFFQVSSGLEINYMRIGFANPYSEKHTLHSVFSLFPPLLLFPPPNHFSFFHTSSMMLKWVRN